MLARPFFTMILFSYYELSELPAECPKPNGKNDDGDEESNAEDDHDEHTWK